MAGQNQPGIPSGGNPRNRTPVRLGRSQGGGRSFGDVLKGLGALLLLAMLVFGAPASLVMLIGWPLPHSLPSLDTFSQPFTTEVFVNVLAILVWIAWAQFAACVLVEAKAAASGVGMPRSLPGAGASQALARQLVAAVLLLTASAASVAPVISQVAPQTTSVVASVQHQHQQHAGVGAGGQQVSQASSHHIVTAEEEAAREAHARQQRHAEHVVQQGGGHENVPQGCKLYQVQPPQGRHHDTLWEIAERHLGNARRWHEIFELNKDRPQPDGTQLTKASLIYPGWVLVMPGDAHGGDLVDPGPSGGGQHHGGGHHQQQDGNQQHQQQGGQHAESADPASAVNQDVQNRIALGLLAAPLLSAGVLAALGTRRRQAMWARAFGARPLSPGDWAGAEEEARYAADTESSEFVDAALRRLAADLAAAGRPLPSVYAARLDGTGLELQLSPGDPDAPAPWQSSPDGRSWHVTRAAVPAGPAPAGVAPYPGLVSLGADLSTLDAANEGRIGRDQLRDQTVLVDLEAASGLISLTGADAPKRREVLAALAAELAVNPWSDKLRLTLVGFGAELRALAPERIRTSATLAGIIGELEQEAAERSRALAAAGLDSVLSGRLGAAGADAWQPHYVIIGEAPEGELAARLARLAAPSHRTAITHLVGGPVPGAAWEWTLDAGQRRLSVPLLGVHVRPNLLPDAQYGQLVQAFRAAAQAPRRPAGPAPEPAPAMPTERPQIEVGLLGPLTVRGAAALEPEREALCHEALAYLALRREGVHVNVLASKLWPRGVSADVRDTTVQRLADWLGPDTSGAPHLVREQDGRIRLGGGVLSDWELFRALTARAEANPALAEESWAQALSLVRGPVLADRRQGRFAWLAHEDLEGRAAAEIADAALRLAAKRLQGGRAEPAADAVRSGLRGNPDDESLWFALLRTVHAGGDEERLREAVRLLLARMQERTGLTEPDAQTAAMLDEVLPTWRETAAA